MSENPKDSKPIGWDVMVRDADGEMRTYPVLVGPGGVLYIAHGPESDDEAKKGTG